MSEEKSTRRTMASDVKKEIELLADSYGLEPIDFVQALVLGFYSSHALVQGAMMAQGRMAVIAATTGGKIKLCEGVEFVKPHPLAGTTIQLTPGNFDLGDTAQE